MDTQTEAGTGTVKVDQSAANEFFIRYAGVKSLLDLAVRHEDPREWLKSRIDEVCEVVAVARGFVKTGKGVTMTQALGFGSESLSAICASIVNERLSSASLKGKAGKAGRDLIRDRRA